MELMKSMIDNYEYYNNSNEWTIFAQESQAGMLTSSIAEGEERRD